MLQSLFHQFFSTRFLNSTRKDFFFNLFWNNDNTIKVAKNDITRSNSDTTKFDGNMIVYHFATRPLVLGKCSHGESRKSKS